MVFGHDQGERWVVHALLIELDYADSQIRPNVQQRAILISKPNWNEKHILDLNFQSSGFSLGASTQFESIES